MSEREPASPCISVCVLDINDICMGCYRSAEEVTDWSMASGDEKRKILQQAYDREKASTNIKLN